MIFHKTKPHPPKTALSLASLVKGEVLSPEKIRATTGGIASPPSLACTNPPNPALSLAPHHVLALLAPPVAPNTSIPTTIAKGQQPLAQHHVLASLVKGEVLSPEKIRATTGVIVTPPTFPKPHYPLLRTMSLPLLSKVRCCHPKKFGRLPEGLLYTHQPFQNRTIPPTFRRVRVCVCLYGFVSALSLAQYHVLASLVKGEVLSPEKIRATTGGIAIPSPPSMRFSALLYS